MGFVKSMVSNNRGAGWNAQQDPNAVNNLADQYGVIKGTQSQLQGVADGTGANPALSMLQKTTDQNIAQNAGFIASQKGINPALAARLGAQNAGMMQQGAATDASTMMANQQLGALNQLGNLATNTQSNIQQGLNSANSANVNIAQGNQKAQAGLVNGAGAALGGFFAHGGMIPSESAPLSSVGLMMSSKPQAPITASHGALVPGRAEVSGDSLRNDKVPAVLSPGEIVIPRSIAQGKNAPKRSAEFVARVLAGNGLRK